MSHRFWDGWLITVTAGVIAFSASLVVFPQLSQSLFDSLFARQLAAHQPFEPSAADYVRFVYGVLGAVMIGWMVSLLFLIAGPFRERTRFGWLASWSAPAWPGRASGFGGPCARLQAGSHRRTGWRKP